MILPLFLFSLNCVFLFFSYQDANNKAWYCYCASLKWLGLRLDFLSSILVTVVTLAAIFLSGDAGKSLFFLLRYVVISAQ